MRVSAYLFDYTARIFILVRLFFSFAFSSGGFVCGGGGGKDGGIEYEFCADVCGGENVRKVYYIYVYNAANAHLHDNII